jgi:hypothetical protein
MWPAFVGVVVGYGLVIVVDVVVSSPGPSSDGVGVCAGGPVTIGLS